MATKPLTNESIALTEKKMDMTLDDIIRMSKNNATKAKKLRVSNRSKKFVNNVSQDKSAKMQRFMDTRSTLRQGALAQRRSNFQENQFHFATEAARKAAAAPIRPIRRPFSGSRAGNVNKMRFMATQVQRRAANGGGFNVKQSQPQVKVVTKQRPPTLDSLFANMQRTRVLSQQNNVARRNGGSQQRPPWHRARFGN